MIILHKLVSSEERFTKGIEVTFSLEISSLQTQLLVNTKNAFLAPYIHISTYQMCLVELFLSRTEE